MIPSSPNAFLGNHYAPHAHPTGSLAGLLAAMRARHATTGFGYQLHLEPLRFTDVIPLWGELVAAEPGSTTMLVDLGRVRRGRNRHDEPLPALARRSGAAAVQAFGDVAVVLPDEEAGSFVAVAGERELAAIRVEGPVESRDAEAMIRALRRGDSPLDFECRAAAALCSGGARSVRLDSREPASSLRVVAEAFRHYVAALRKRDVPAIAVPESWLMQRLLDVAGEISVRPIETEVFTTSIDVGICAEAGGPTRPANRSLIYDVHSNTWHDES